MGLALDAVLKDVCHCYTPCTLQTCHRFGHVSWWSTAPETDVFFFYFRNVFLSSSILFLKLQHFHSGCGLLCRGHCLLGLPSSWVATELPLLLFAETSVLFTATDVLTWLLFRICFFCLGCARRSCYGGKAEVIACFCLFTDEIYEDWEPWVWDPMLFLIAWSNSDPLLL